MAKEKHEEENGGRIITTGPIPNDLLEWLDKFCASGMKPSKHGVIAESLRRFKASMESKDQTA